MTDATSMCLALAWAGSPYKARNTPKWLELYKKLDDAGVTPVEYLAGLRGLEEVPGPEKFVENYLCSETAWKRFNEAREARICENRIRMDLQRRRVRMLLADPSMDMPDIANSSVETFNMVVRYVLSRVCGDDELAVRFGLPAAYELRVAPELGPMISDWGLEECGGYLHELEALAND